MIRGHEFSGDWRRWRGILSLLEIGGDCGGCELSGDRRR
jgi:hypothetical protein